jgi:hypothetical protein
MLNARARNISYLLVNELPKESHSEHAVSNHAIKANSLRGLLIKMNGIVIA